MAEGLVFGKFYPFHKGHDALIRFAAEQVELLHVLVCCSDRELIEPAVRLQWLQEAYAGDARISVEVYHYEETALANSSVPSEGVSAAWAEVFASLFPALDLLVTSEAYGPMVARVLGIRHMLFDMERQQQPWSGTALRNGLLEAAPGLMPACRDYFHRKVVLLGTESSGKTTLAGRLSQHFNQPMVRELGRELIPDSSQFDVQDLQKVAHAHAKAIKEAMEGKPLLLLIDTDLHITQSYAKHFFGSYLELDPTVYQSNRADLYLYLDASVPFVQDGTRLDEQSRNALDRSHRETLQAFGIDYIVLEGSYAQREERAIQLIRKLFEHRWYA